MAIQLQGITVNGGVRGGPEIFQFLFQFDVIPEGATDVVILFSDPEGGSFTFNSINKTLGAKFQKYIPLPIYIFRFQFIDISQQPVGDPVFVSVDGALADSPTYTTTPVTTVQNTATSEGEISEATQVITYEDLGPENKALSSNPTERNDAIPPGGSIPPNGYSGLPSDPVPSVPTVPTQLPLAPQAQTVETSPGVFELVYPPGFLSPSEGRLSITKDMETFLYFQPDDVVDIVFEGGNWDGATPLAGITTFNITNIAIDEGELPAFLTVEYPYDDGMGPNPNKLRISGTVPEISWPEEFFFIISITNEYGVFHDRIFSIFLEPDRGFFVFNAPFDETPTGNQVELNVGARVTKVYIKTWGAGGGGHGGVLNLHPQQLGGGGAFTRSLYPVIKEGDAILFEIGNGGIFAPQALTPESVIASAQAGEQTIAIYRELDIDPQSPTFGEVLSQTTATASNGGGGALYNATGPNPINVSVGQEIEAGNGIFPGGANDIHAGTTGNAYGGAGIQNGRFGRAYIEFGPHINAASSINELL